MRYSRKDLDEINAELQTYDPLLGLRKLDSRVGGYWVVRYYEATGPTYNNVSGMLRSKEAVQAFLLGLRKGSELREAAIRRAIGQSLDDLGHVITVEEFIARMTTWAPA